MLKNVDVESKCLATVRQQTPWIGQDYGKASVINC